jgi:aminotransferase in exopolysaccharide biosynthesis
MAICERGDGLKREIPLSVPSLGMDIADSLRECVETGWVSTGGRFIGEFEAAVADYAGAAGAVGCQSGTAGLHVALRVLGVGPGDEVIVPSLTFIAAVNPVAYQGAEPVFMDCDAGFCIDAGKLGRFCAEECRMEGRRLVDMKTGRRVAAVIVVHVFGNMADMEGVMSVARRYGLKVIEDATEAIGSYFTRGRYRGRHAGTVGDLGVYSFNANKIITTGGGGMIIAGPRGRKRLERARYLSTTAKDDGLRFVHNDIGYNYRMLNIQAAFGISQIKQLESFIEKKKRNYESYAECMGAMGIEGVRLLPYSEGQRQNHWFYPFEIDEAAFGKSRDALMLALVGEGIQCRPVWRLCHMQRPYRKARRYRISLAARYEKSLLNLPCSTGLTRGDVEYICRAIKRIGGA